MHPLRIEDLGVEPVSVAEMRAYLRLDPDDASEDALVAGLIAAARAAVETESRRLLRPARFRLSLPAWPAEGVLPLPLSPLVGLVLAGAAGMDGSVEAVEPGTIRPGPDPWEAPCLLIGRGLPPLAGRAALIEVSAGCGGAGPPVPGPLVQAVRLCVAAWFENRGDAGPDEVRSPPAGVAGLVAPHRLMRL